MKKVIITFSLLALISAGSVIGTTKARAGQALALGTVSSETVLDQKTGGLDVLVDGKPIPVCATSGLGNTFVKRFTSGSLRVSCVNTLLRQSGAVLVAEKHQGQIMQSEDFVVLLNNSSLPILLHLNFQDSFGVKRVTVSDKAL